MKYYLKFKPHLGFCSTPFIVESENLNFIRYQASLLVSLQNFLQRENHSSLKANLEFHDENGKLNQSHQIVEGINKNTIYGFQEQNRSEFNVSPFKNAGVGILQYFPQIPCTPFTYPFAIADKEAISNLLGNYNQYLLDCGLRCDYSDVLCFSFFDPEASKYIDNDSVTSDVDLWFSSIDDDIRMMLDDDSTEDDELAEIVLQMNDCYDEIRSSTEFCSIKNLLTVDYLKDYRLSFYKYFI